jgi:hypothetical protein
VFATDDQLSTFLDVLLKPQDGATRPAWWAEAITRANASAYADLLSVLGGRGLSAAQIAGFSRGQEWQLQQALYYLALWGRIDTPINGQDLDKLDRREAWAKDVLTDADGAPVTAAGTVVAGVGHGTMETATEKQRRLCAEQRQRERGGPLEYFNW